MNSIARRYAAITPNDTTPNRWDAIYVGGAGNVSVTNASNSTPVVFVGVPVGTVLQVNCATVRATGTTATNLVGLTY